MAIVWLGWLAWYAARRGKKICPFAAEAHRKSLSYVRLLTAIFFFLSLSCGWIWCQFEFGNAIGFC